MPESPKTAPKGMLLAAVLGSEAIDSSGEVLDVRGADISDLEAGLGQVNYEHRGDESEGASGDDWVGRIVFAKKVFGRADCDDKQQRKFWDELELPFIYGVVRLYDAAGHAGARALAAAIRDHHANGEKILWRWSVEGSTLKSSKNGKHLDVTMIRNVAMTKKPCNRSAETRIVADPQAPEGFDKRPVKVEEDWLEKVLERSDAADAAGTRRLGSAVVLEYDPVVDPDSDLAKALSAGSYDAAPSTLTGGAALQRESGFRARAKAAVRDWDGTSPFRTFLKHRLPEADDSFIDRFADAVEVYKIPRRVLLKREGALTIRGKPVRARAVKEPTFDEQRGVLHTPRGSFPVYVPSRDPDPAAGESFHRIMSDPKLDAVHSKAMKNWRRVNERLRGAGLPPEVLMHATLFSQNSPNTPVPVQELMFSVDTDTILVTNDGIWKRIADFRPGDRINGIAGTGEIVVTDVVAVHDHGVLPGFEVEFDDGYTIVCSQNHKFLTGAGMAPLSEIFSTDEGVLCEPETQSRWVAESVRPVVRDPRRVQWAQKIVHHLQGDLAKQEIGECRQVASGAPGRCGEAPREDARWEGALSGRESRGGYGWHQEMGAGEAGGVRGQAGEGGVCDGAVAGAECGESDRAQSDLDREGENLAAREPRSLCRSDKEDGAGAQASQGRVPVVKGGGVAPEDWDADLGFRAGPLRRGAQAGGLRRPGSQDLGGGGRLLPLLRVPGPESVPLGGPGEGRDAQRGGAPPRRRDVAQVLRRVLPVIGREDEGGMERLALGDAPLADSGNLVLRKIVRVRPVGLRRMYDLEVSHSRHNFLLPNGVVTSNSHLVDEMNSSGIDARDPRFGALKEGWLARDRPHVLPEHARKYFERIRPTISLGNDSKRTERKAGEIGSFMLPSSKWEKMERYHQLHGALVDLVKRHGGDARSAVGELMDHKRRGRLWAGLRERAVRNGRADPGPYQGPDVPGLAPKTARYMYGMIGGSNCHVPDTHFIRHLFGLDKVKDSATIEHLKNTLWSTNNGHVLDGIDRFYAKNHDAVKHVRENTDVGRAAESDEAAIFPSFWRHWLAIAPHEASRGMGQADLAFNQATTHEPFWQAVNPYLRRSEPGPVDQELVARTVAQHLRWARQYGENAAMLLYFANLAPHLLGDGAPPPAHSAIIRKFEMLSLELRKVAAAGRAVESPAPEEPKEVEHAGQRVRVGLARAGKDRYSLLHAAPDHFVAVPEGREGKHGAPDVVKLVPGPGLKVDRWPEVLDAGTKVDAERHGSDLNRTPEQRALIHGLDFGESRLGAPVGALRIQMQSPYHWRRGPTGAPVFVKPDHEGDASREVAFHNVARDFFGLGKYTAVAAHAHHPRDGRGMAVIEAVQGGEHQRDGDEGQRAKLAGMDASGDLDKLALMDVVMNTWDRHQKNYMFTRGGDPPVKLFDHGDALGDGRRVDVLPEYVAHHHRLAYGPPVGDEEAPRLDDAPVNPEAVKWLQGLSEDDLAKHLAENRVPEQASADALYRLRNLKEHLRQHPDLSRARAYRSPAYDAEAGVRFAHPNAASEIAQDLARHG